MFYQNEVSEIKFFSNNLNAKLFSIMVVKLSDPTQERNYEFFKLIIEATRLTKQNTEKGKEMAIKIERYIEKTYDIF